MSLRKKLWKLAVSQSSTSQWSAWLSRAAFVLRSLHTFYLKRKYTKLRAWLLYPQIYWHGESDLRVEGGSEPLPCSFIKPFSFLLLLRHNLFERSLWSNLLFLPRGFPSASLVTMTPSLPVAWSISVKIFKACGIVIKWAHCIHTSPQDSKTVVLRVPSKKRGDWVEPVLINQDLFFQVAYLG